MSSWTHSQCDDCWQREHPDRTPVRLTVRERETCCLCGGEDASGIYVRADPATMPNCHGHEDDR